jgi:hypothetical protein
MTIPDELAAQIERMYKVERWRVGTIARQLNVHHDTVRRVLREHAVVSAGPLRPSLIDPYRGFIRETLEKYPTLTARRLLDMVCERGYTGQASHFRHLVSTMRPRPPARPTCACARCRASRCRWTGLTFLTCNSVVRGAR